MDKLRLLILTFDPPQNIGGVEGRVQGYLQELRKRRDFVEVEAFAPDYGFTTESFNGVRLHKSPSDLRALHDSLSYTLKLIDGNSFDSIFLLSGGLTVLGNFLLLYARIRRKRTAILLYGKDILQARKNGMGKFLLFAAQSLTDRIATNSRLRRASLANPRWAHSQAGFRRPS